MKSTIFSYAGQSNLEGFRSELQYIPSFGLHHGIPLIRGGAVGDLGPFLVRDPENDNGFRESGFVPEGQATLGYGVEVFLSRIFDSPENEVVSLKTARGGTSLAVNWNPERRGSSWRQFEHDTEVARSLAESLPGETRTGPLIWWHGETDSTKPDFAAAYGRNLPRFIESYREMVGDPAAKVVLVLTVTGGGGQKLRAVQEAQRDLAAHDPNVILYDPSHLHPYPDNLHFGADYSIEAAADIADLIVAAGWERTPNLWGTSGSERLIGTGADQFIWGLAGQDTLRGEGGDDTLAGDLGADALDGGDGTDTVVYDAATGGVEVNLTTRDGRGDIAEGDRFARVENVQGGNYADTLTGDGAHNLLEGGNGDDRLAGADGRDTLAGGAGDDTLRGNAGTDELFGEAGNDRLYGGAARDLLRGGDGDDRLTGGAEGDRLVGGGGADTFVFQRAGHSTLSRTDVIEGFDAPGRAAGDVIDLSAIDADTSRAGNQSFTFGPAEVGRISVIEHDGETLVRGDVDGDRGYEFAVLIRDGDTPASAYTADDFIL